MPLQITIHVFLIRRLNIELRVVLRSTGLVTVAPHQCKEENLRLWTGIAKTQTILAQGHLEQNRNAKLLDRLAALFQSSGWEVTALEERNEFSL